MKKNYLTSGIALAMMLTASMASAETFSVGNLTYETISDNTCKLTALEGDDTETLEIPATVTNEGVSYSVTAIGNDACRGKETLQEVKIPDSVETIGTYAFYQDYNLKTVSIGAGVTTIGNQAFEACYAIKKITVYAVVAPVSSSRQGTIFSEVTINTATLYVPKESMGTKEGDYNFPFSLWQGFAKIRAIGDEEPEEPIDPPVEPETGLKMTAMSPASGKTVHSLNVIMVAFELAKAEEEDYVINANTGAANLITLTLPDNTTIHPTSVRPVEGFPVTTIAITFPYQDTEGDYTLTIGEGAISKMKFETETSYIPVEGATNKEITATYTVSEIIPTVFDSYILAPASGKTLASIYEINLHFDKAPYALNINERLPIVLTNGTDSYTASDDGWGNERRFHFHSATDRYVTITEPGVWTLTIPEGVFSANGEKNREIVATYTIGQEFDFDYVCTPLNLSKEELPEAGIVTISFNFPDASEVKFPALTADLGETFVVKYGDEVITRVSNAMTRKGYSTQIYEGDPTLQIRLNNQIFTEPGILTIQAEKGAFTVDGIDSPAIDYAVNYAVERTFTYTIDPAPGESLDLSKFTVAFPDATEAKFIPEEAFVVLFKLPDPFTEYICTPVEDAECPTFEIIFDPAPTEYGEYNFTIDSRSFLLDKYFFNPIVTGKYQLVEELGTGIEEIAAGAEAADVYSLDGRLVLTKATEAEIRSLDPGIYVAGGRKICIGK